MTNKKGRKGGKKTLSGLPDALERYKRNLLGFRKFEEEENDIISEWKDRRESLALAKKALETQALEESKHTKKGRHSVLELDGFVLSHKITARREVDTTALLKKYPKLSKWPGLFTAKIGEFEAVLASGQVDAEEAGRYVTEKVSKGTIEIEETEQDGETDREEN